MGLFNGFRKTKDRPRSPSAAEAQKQQQQQQQRDQQRDQAQAQPQPQQQQQQQQQKRSVAYADPPAASEQDEQGLEDSVPQHLAQEPYSAPEPYPEPGTPPHSRRPSVALLASNNSSLYRSNNGTAQAMVSGVMATPRQGESPYDVPYGHTRVFMAASYDQVLDRAIVCLQTQGFHILASIDLQQALQAAKVQCGDFRRYTVLTACYPKLLFKGIFEEPSLGLLPPSQVVVMEGDFNKQDIVVQVTKPSTIYRALHNQSPKLRGILSETDGRLKMALDAISSVQDDYEPPRSQIRGVGYEHQQHEEPRMGPYSGRRAG